jgi:hypothetical protein
VTDNHSGDRPPQVPPGASAYPAHPQPQQGPTPYSQQPGYPHYPSVTPQFAPPPRRRKRRWPWAIAGIVGVSVMAGAVLAADAYLRAFSILQGPQHEYAVIYEVTGTATSANILYGWPDHDPSNGNEGDGPEMTLPWRGVESMTRAPWVLPKPAHGHPAGDVTAVLVPARSAFRRLLS